MSCLQQLSYRTVWCQLHRLLPFCSIPPPHSRRLQRETDRKLRVTGRRLDEVVEGLNNGETGDLLLGSNVGGPARVPRSLVGLLDEVVAVESGVGDEGDLLGLEADHLEHLGELVLDLVESVLGPVAGVHLVDTDNDLVDSEQVEETGVLR